MAELHEFTAHRPLLLGLDYRFLGSMWDAEDVVQEAWLGSGTERRSSVESVLPRVERVRLRSCFRRNHPKREVG